MLAEWRGRFADPEDPAHRRRAFLRGCLASLSSLTTNEIVVVEAEPADWSDETEQCLQVRVNEQLDRLDLRFVRLLRAEESEATEGVSFQDFLNRYRPRRLIYACPNCVAGEATPVREQTPSDYQRDGGRYNWRGQW